MQNRHRILELARGAGLELTKQLKCWTSSGELRLIEVDRPVDELADELRERGVLK